MSSAQLGTLVTYNPWTIGATTLLADVTARFDELGIHHVAVVDSERHVIGILSESDLLRSRQAERTLAAVGGGPDTDDAPAVFARDVMSRQVVSVPLTATAADALRVLLDKQIHALPVVQDRRLIGMISSRDFLREFSYGEVPASHEPIASLLGEPGPEPLDPDATLDEAFLAMHESGVSRLAVAKDGCPVGILTQRDIIRERCRQMENEGGGLNSQPPSDTIHSAVRSSPILRPGHRLCDAAAAMVDQRLPAVTIVNPSNRLLGLVTEDDILRVLYDAQA
ncbi:MAG TPA: CBS domain-containing protein [Pirellulaceae bacterium]|nr:CBS domain-containing protein [Pirellulaceae bacterium]